MTYSHVAIKFQEMQEIAISNLFLWTELAPLPNDKEAQITLILILTFLWMVTSIKVMRGGNVKTMPHCFLVLLLLFEDWD
jgi:hypothetical protein